MFQLYFEINPAKHTKSNSFFIQNFMQKKNSGDP